jgi:hypothetical protein
VDDDDPVGGPELFTVPPNRLRKDRRCVDLRGRQQGIEVLRAQIVEDNVMAAFLQCRPRCGGNGMIETPRIG